MREPPRRVRSCVVSVSLALLRPFSGPSQGNSREAPCREPRRPRQANRNATTRGLRPGEPEDQAMTTRWKRFAPGPPAYFDGASCLRFSAIKFSRAS